jgi:nucleoid-associated protein YgaU
VTRERQRNGVRIGQTVRDVDGKVLGKVTDLYAASFSVARGFMMFRSDHVLAYDEVRGERDGALVVARSDSQLQELAAGELPSTWTIPVPPDFPAAATPGEARGVFGQLARERAQEAAVAATPVEAPAPAREARPVGQGEVATYVARRGETPPVEPTAPPHS